MRLLGTIVFLVLFAVPTFAAEPGTIPAADVVPRLEADATQGDADAQGTLGVLYYEGLGVPQDFAEAARWFRKSAAQGLAMSQYNLGYLYEQGRGVPQDPAEAAKWYRKAANQGNTAAQWALDDLSGIDTTSSRRTP